MTKYKTEKRKANVGERILITEANTSFGDYANGDVFTASIFYAGQGVIIKGLGEEVSFIGHDEYEVIVEAPKPTKNERITALETEVAELKAKVDTLEQANKPRGYHFEVDGRVVKPGVEWVTMKTPNQRRADVIKRAKAFVDEFLSDKPVKRRIVFNVNTEKRTVVALFYSFDTHPATVVSKGIAKCGPSDVFNADIGKAIALARALGVEVPTEFVKAVQPTEVVVGMEAEINGTFEPYVSTIVRDGIDISAFTNNVGFIRNNPRYLIRILDDTDAVYE